LHLSSRYDAFGETIGETGNVANKYLFAGEQFDEILGDYYLRARYYDASTGRFTRRDTYEGRLGEPLTLHKYTYTHNNPVNGIDPTGLYTYSLTDTAAAEAIRNDIIKQYLQFASRFVLDVAASYSSEAKNLKTLIDFSSEFINELSEFQPVVLHASSSSNGLWTPNPRRGWSPARNAYEHWKKHRSDYPSNVTNSVQFVEWTKDFIRNPPKTAYKKTRTRDGAIIVYDPPTELFAVAQSNGTPRTIYRPDPSIHGYTTNKDYFDAQ
jgi:RHS repeat-associated protein